MLWANFSVYKVNFQDPDAIIVTSCTSLGKRCRFGVAVLINYKRAIGRSGSCNVALRSDHVTMLTGLRRRQSATFLSTPGSPSRVWIVGVRGIDRDHGAGKESEKYCRDGPKNPGVPGAEESADRVPEICYGL